MKTAVLTLALLNALQLVFASRSFRGYVPEESRTVRCPPPENISPCTCKLEFGMAFMKCRQVNSAAINNALIRLSDYSFQAISIEKSSLEFLPHILIDSIDVREFELDRVNMWKLFDKPPKPSFTIGRLTVRGVRIASGGLWNLLTPLKALSFLDVEDANGITKLDSEFSSKASKFLQSIILVETDIYRLESGVFKGFHDLRQVTIDRNRDEFGLQNWNRKIFDVPFKGTDVSFQGFKLEAIPDDMFTRMPNLERVHLNDNLIKVVPESAFDGRSGELDYLGLRNNPIECDCKLLWLIKNKPKELEGTCASPNTLKGKRLESIIEEDLRC